MLPKCFLLRVSLLLPPRSNIHLCYELYGKDATWAIFEISWSKKSSFWIRQVCPSKIDPPGLHTEILSVVKCRLNHFYEIFLLLSAILSASLPFTPSLLPPWTIKIVVPSRITEIREQDTFNVQFIKNNYESPRVGNNFTDLFAFQKENERKRNFLFVFFAIEISPSLAEIIIAFVSPSNPKKIYNGIF